MAICHFYSKYNAQIGVYAVGIDVRNRHGTAKMSELQRQCGRIFGGMPAMRRELQSCNSSENRVANPGDIVCDLAGVPLRVEDALIKPVVRNSSPAALSQWTESAIPGLPAKQ
jgi:hypothetical protein